MAGVPGKKRSPGRPRKTAAQKRAEKDEELREAGIDPEHVSVEILTPEQVADREVVHGDIMEKADGSIEVVNPVPPSQTLSVKERQRMAMNLKMMGASYQAIADQLGYADASGAYQAVQAGSKAALKDSAIDLRNVTYLQLQNLLMVWWPRALKGDRDAGVMVLQIQDRVRQLFGLDGLPAAEEIQEEGVLVIGGTEDQYREGLKRVRRDQHMQGGVQ